MYARYFLFKASPEKRKAIEEMADEIYGFMKFLNGFVSAKFIISEDESEYGSFSVWNTKKDAEEAGTAIQDKYMSTIGEVAIAPPEVVVMEIYDPK